MVSHLPPAIKHLLALRNPNSWPTPPRATLQRIFTETLSDAKLRKAETGWLVLVTCSLLTSNRPGALAHLYQFATRSDADDGRTRRSVADAVNKAALMRESALKSAIFVGVPRTIQSLAALTATLEEDVKSRLRTKSLRDATPENVQSMIARGKSLWHSIYQPHADKLHDKLASYHPDFMSFVIQAYGSLLAPLPHACHEVDCEGDDGQREYHRQRQQGDLSRALSSVVATACLRAEGRVGPQLTSHVFGLLKARSGVRHETEDAWLASDEGAEWVIRTVDSIVDGVTGQEFGRGCGPIS